jgi:hypothetical protein
MKVYWEVELQLHAFLTLALDGGGQPRPGRFMPGKEPPVPIG